MARAAGEFEGSGRVNTLADIVGYVVGDPESVVIGRAAADAAQAVGRLPELRSGRF
ncbi:hypothetical protein [Mycobacterium sp.]|jgi:hypothetical protein|uniref:hypothetical protein n=1 Tax=Mycobacterium sp. TaxID=1785 RepID=UPI00333FCA53